MKIELTRFRVLPNKTPVVNEWLALLNDNMPAVLETLEGERIYVETIFSETVDAVDYLYWYSIQGAGGTDVHESEHEIDRVHLKYWKECIDPDFAPQELTPRVSMIPAAVARGMR